MAKLNYSESAPLASGKVGGQQIIKNRHGVILQSVSQPPSFGNVEQKKKRFETNTISQRYRQLTATQKNSYINEAINYHKIGKFGESVPRTGYGLFLFLNQNLKLSGKTAPLIAPPFEVMTDPQPYIIERTSSSFIIQSDNVEEHYLYAVFANVQIPPGSQSSRKFEKFCGMVTPSDLSIGIDLYDIIQDQYNFDVSMLRTGVRISSIDQLTGNRIDSDGWTKPVEGTTLMYKASLPDPILCSQLTNDGAYMFNLLYFLFIDEYELSPPFNVENDSASSGFSPPFTRITQFAFSVDGQYLYLIVRIGTPWFLVQYFSNTPYAFGSYTQIGSLQIPSSNLHRSLSIDPTGKYILFGANFNIVKITLDNPHDLNTVLSIDNKPFGFSTQNQAFVYSDTGMTMLIQIGTTINQYSLTTPFQIENFRTNLVNTIDLYPVFNQTNPNGWTLRFQDNGKVLLVAVNIQTVGTDNIATFKLSSPFNIGSINP